MTKAGRIKKSCNQIQIQNVLKLNLSITIQKVMINWLGCLNRKADWIKAGMLLICSLCKCLKNMPPCFHYGVNTDKINLNVDLWLLKLLLGISSGNARTAVEEFEQATKMDCFTWECASWKAHHWFMMCIQEETQLLGQWRFSCLQRVNDQMRR